MKFGKRVLLFLHWLMSVIGMASIVFQKQTQVITQSIQYEIGEKYAHILFIALMAVYAFLSSSSVLSVFSHGRSRSVRPK